jgi:hypothetical protein
MDFDFEDLTPAAVPVKYRGKRYLLREADESACCQYRNAVIRSRKLDADGRLTHLDGLADAEPLLVSLCLFELAEGPGQPSAERPVPLAVVRSWPGRVVKPLFAWLHRASGLREEEETEEVLADRLRETEGKLAALRNGGGRVKNSPPATAGTSG